MEIANYQQILLRLEDFGITFLLLMILTGSLLVLFYFLFLWWKHRNRESRLAIPPKKVSFGKLKGGPENHFFFNFSCISPRNLRKN